MVTAAPESPKMSELRHQLREASSPAAMRQVVASTMIAVRDNEISVDEGKVLNKEFAKINAEERARLKAAQRTLR